MPSKKPPVPSVVDSWMSITSFHGYADIQSAASRIIRGIWIFVIIAATGMLVWQVQMVVDSAVKKPYYMTTTYWENPIDGEDGTNTFTYPPITVCNYQRLSLRRLQDSGLLINPEIASLFYYAMNIPGPLMVDYSSVADPEKIAANAYRDWYMNPNNQFHGWNFTDIVTNLSKTCNEYTSMFMYKFNRMLSPSRGEKCTPASSSFFEPLRIEEVYTKEFGSCSRFHMPSSIVVNTAGPSESVHMILRLDGEDVDYTVNNTHMQSALAIQIGDQIVTGRWTAVSPGTYTSIGITKKEHRFSASQVPIRQPNCYQSTDSKVTKWDDAHYGDVGGYNIVACKERCIVDYSIWKCNCAVGVPSTKYSTCQPHEFAFCMADSMISITEYESTLKQCYTKCLPLCESTSYETKTSIANWPTKHGANTLANHLKDVYSANVTPNDITQFLIPVTIYYDKLEIEVIERFERHRIDEIIGSIGGHMGVWAGASILSAVQLVIHCATYCCQRQQANKVQFVK